LRAVVAEAMRKTGEIVIDNKTYGYPWIGAKIARQNSVICKHPGLDIPDISGIKPESWY